MSNFARWLVAAGIILVALLLLPVAIKYVAESEVSQSGLGTLEIQDIDFNPFTLELSAHEFHLYDGADSFIKGKRAAVNLDWLDLVKGTIGIQSVSAEGAEVWAREVEAGNWVVLPTVESEAETDPVPAESEPVQFWLDALSITGARIHIAGQAIDGTVELPDISLHQLASFKLGKMDTTSQINARWHDAEISMTTSKDLQAERPPFSVKLEIKGLQLADLQRLSGLPELSGVLDLTIDLDGYLSHPPLAADAGIPGVEARTRVAATVQDLVFQDPDGLASVAAVALSFNGETETNMPAEGDLQFGLTGDLSSAAGQVTRDDFLLASWKDLRLTGMSLGSDNRLQLAGLTSALITLMGKDQPMLAGSIEITGVDLVPGEAVSVQSVRLPALKSTVTISAEGQLAGLDVIAGMSPETEETGQSESLGNSSAMRIRLDSLDVTGHLTFTDQSVSPVFSQSIDVEKLQIRNVNTGDPDSSMTMELLSKLDDYSRIDANLSGQLFADERVVSGKGKATQVPLDRMTAYLEKAIGYEIQSGQLDVEAEVELKGQYIHADIDSILRKLRVNPVENSDVDLELGMPLGAALSLVRDNDDNIRLEDIVIEGDLGDPSVSVRSVVSKAVSKALMAGTMTYFQFALQPYGAVMMAAKAIGKQAGKISLEPLRMEAGSAGIDPSNSDYPQRLADLMSGRPGINLVICGEASRVSDLPSETPADPASIQEADAAATEVSPPDPTPGLLALADERARVTKALLFEQGIASDRLLICKSAVNEDAEGARVTLMVD